VAAQCGVSAASRALRGPALYRPRRPAESVLYRVVQEHLETYLALARAGDLDADAVPRFVEREFRRYRPGREGAKRRAEEPAIGARPRAQQPTHRAVESLWERAGPRPFVARRADAGRIAGLESLVARATAQEGLGCPVAHSGAPRRNRWNAGSSPMALLGHAAQSAVTTS
jgi:hypothetical protein